MHPDPFLKNKTPRDFCRGFVGRDPWHYRRGARYDRALLVK